MQCRLDKRMDKNLINLLKSLKEPGFVPSKSALNIDSRLHLFSWDLPSNDYNIENRENGKDNQKPFSIADELSMPHKESNNFSRIKQEFALFQKTGKRTENLELLNEALCSIKPTSTDNERTFSVASRFSTKKDQGYLINQ
jgi:hypothetical protein